MYTCFSPCRDDFERIGISNLVTAGVRDIQGEGFPEEFAGLADAVFLDLPQPWLAIPSAAKMLRHDGTLCSFSPCIEQVQRSCETMQSNFTGTSRFSSFICYATNDNFIYALTKVLCICLFM
jgi:tRNA (adenine57-N1/adenine58-N1)-methyltransferase catalytic subunit